MNTEQSALDQNQIQVLRGLDSQGEVLSRLILVFGQEVSQHLAELDRQFAAKNFRVCKYLVHSIRSSALNIGARRLAILADRLEGEFSHRIVNISYRDLLELRETFYYCRDALMGLEGLPRAGH